MERRRWLSTLKNEFRNTPLLSNVAVDLILTCLEKLVEWEFVCPCNPWLNILLSSALFIIPAAIASFLMFASQEYRRAPVTAVMYSLVSAVVWLILLFLDGQYFVCAKTDWEGWFVILDKAAPLKWCKPYQGNDSGLNERMLRSKEFFNCSQAIGLILLSLMSVGLILYLLKMTCKRQEQAQEGENIEIA